jgi:hypothetical protein
MNIKYIPEFIIITVLKVKYLSLRMIFIFMFHITTIFIIMIKF